MPAVSLVVSVVLKCVAISNTLTRSALCPCYVCVVIIIVNVSVCTIGSQILSG